ncbi:hypothetical protein B0A69_06060 [Chryseobacterium shigense]|uniref:Uncharacterized protein n=1 Tax=Chryseobacterium shigense TaxID=297244 RepID=A0A1N7IJS9_9FLAO|nr:hypothetical protein [Chryseobacterium shigense]PQA95931.1 hypothetical protein B0A69_06060 [Chryseobacterium shigense]SIS37241.1 hypothetical protein SAMN05421639_10451 [Chryseobacterium shigense]
MKKNVLTLLAFGLFATAVHAQETVKQEVKNVGTAIEKGAKATEKGVKNGAEWVGDKAKKGATATKKGVKKSTKWVGKTATKGAKSVKKTAVKGADAVADGYKDVKADLKK